LEKNTRIILSVTNDLSTDQRVHKVALSLMKIGYTPILLGRQLKGSKSLKDRPYQTKRFKLPFSKSWIFYASYNIRLFCFLLYNKASILVSNDLDTLPANYFVYKIKRLFGNKNLKLVYDSHELFTEVPELNGRKLVKKTWLLIENLMLPKIKNTYTVCESISEYYNKKYGIKMQVIQNLPFCNTDEIPSSQINIKLPDNKRIILYQGVLNMGRGIELFIQIIDKIRDAVLVIAGTGDIERNLKKLVNKKKLSEKVIFTGSIPLENLSALTKKADIGLVLQEDISLSYRYVLPNRLFDFVKAKVPVLASNLPEIKKIVEKERIGLTIKGFDSELMIKKVNELLNNKRLVAEIKKNMEECSSKYCWETQEKVLFELFQNLE